MKTFLFFTFLVSVFLLVNPVYAAKCTATKPDKAPDLFQIDVTKTSAQLYFSPVNNAITNYTIIYGLEKHRPDYGVSFPFGQYEGVVNYTVNDLTPNTKYYFRVRADNGCRQGYWSDTMSVETNWDFKTYTNIKGDVQGVSDNEPTRYSPNFPTSTFSTDITFEEKDLTEDEMNNPILTETKTPDKINKKEKQSLFDLISLFFSKVLSFLNIK